MSREIQELVRKHRVENEYALGEALASALVAAGEGISAFVARIRKPRPGAKLAPT